MAPGTSGSERFLKAYAGYGDTRETDSKSLGRAEDHRSAGSDGDHLSSEEGLGDGLSGHDDQGAQEL